ncbi:MAG TPA: hypothetical protein PKD48_11755 [Sphingopyxis sp.]|nr:hypothetical protein [Sphingopyxis sp.]HMQ19846.1 hypothetical protein [Sphingopyxis sp.]
MVRVSSAILLVSALGGCAANPDQSKTDKLRSALAELEKQCDVAQGTLAVGADGFVNFRPSPGEKYEKIDCVARGLKNPEFADHVKMGFVGNEMHPREEQK